MNVKDCIAIVTGGASGLGEATVRNVVKLGGRAAILDIQVERGENLAKELGSNVIFVAGDVTKEADVENAVAKTIAAFGSFNFVVNCAGVANPSKIISKKGVITLDAFKKVIDINLSGTFNVIRLAVEKMKDNAPNAEGERGVMINVASVATYDGQIGQAAYAASKAGVMGMCLPIARECADYGIRCMSIAPGIFDTPMVGALPEAAKASLGQMMPFPKRLGKPTEFASLAQEIYENPYMNGECIRLDASVRLAAK
jgi:3-hydroxyacyl-CoA dehydrogenase / 3-hydroxy-2-methylbutyryl-CoA dehydrogenase